MSTHTQVPIPCMVSCAGTTKGLLFDGSDLPTDIRARDRFLGAAVSPAEPQSTRHFAGGEQITSRIAIVFRWWRPGVSVDFLYKWGVFY
jgi:2-methylaconitate cis-trans-isomerase PrpF